MEAVPPRYQPNLECYHTLHAQSLEKVTNFGSLLCLYGHPRQASEYHKYITSTQFITQDVTPNTHLNMATLACFTLCWLSFDAAHTCVRNVTLALCFL